MPASLTLSDWLGLVGIALSLLGFGISIFQIRKTKNAAESAGASATLARQEIARLDALLEFASVSKAMDDIKTAFREERLDAIPLLLDGARRSLISAMEVKRTLQPEQRNIIAETLSFLTDLEVLVSKSKRDQLESRKVKVMKALVQHSNNVTSLLAASKVGA